MKKKLLGAAGVGVGAAVAILFLVEEGGDTPQQISAANAPAEYSASTASVREVKDKDSGADGSRPTIPRLPKNVSQLTGTLFPADPYSVYVANIEGALSGDVEAQYSILRVFRECAMAPRTNDELAEIREALGHDESFVAEQEYRYKRCKQISGTRGEIESARQHWLRAAIDNGHPLAIAYESVVFGDDHAEARVALLDGLATGSHEAYEYAAIFVGRQLSNQFGDAAEEDSWQRLYSECRAAPGCDTTSYDVLATTATAPWSLLACKKNPACDVDRYVEQNLSSVLDNATVATIRARANVIEQTVLSGNLGELDF